MSILFLAVCVCVSVGLVKLAKVMLLGESRFFPKGNGMVFSCPNATTVIRYLLFRYWIKINQTEHCKSMRLRVIFPW